jgi:hypothetical protein
VAVKELSFGRLLELAFCTGASEILEEDIGGVFILFFFVRSSKFGMFLFSGENSTESIKLSNPRGVS